MHKFAKYITLGLIAGLVVTGCGTEGTATSTDSGIAAAESTVAETGSTVDTESSVASATEEASAPMMDLDAFTASDYVTLKNYTEIVVNEADVEATDEQLQTKIDEFTTTYAPADYEAKDGDTVNIDYVGKKDDVAFDGGTAQGYDLTLGSDSFIDGFEDGLIGTKAGDQISLNLTFPEDYHSEELAGAAVVFDVTVNSIKPAEPVEYTDELVAANTEFTTTDAYNEYLKEQIKESNKQTAASQAIMDLGEFTGEYPEALEQYYIDYYTQMYNYYYGAEALAEAAADYDSTDAYIKEYLGEGIEQQYKADLLLLAVAEKEGMVCEGEDYDSYIAEVVENIGSSEDELYETYGDGFVHYSYLTDRAYKLLNERIVVK